jgi:hypothetical protein
MNDKLGIFYSNNNNPSTYPAIQASLHSIRSASYGVADIVTCVWNPIKGNPFKELIAWTKTTSHLNQTLQILQCLYTAREDRLYQYVSFLEHDVLYPIGYFDFPKFKRGEVLVNMNYGGMIPSGFQKRKQDDQPFHQMTMRFDEAISHCEDILVNAIVTNSGIIEPKNHKRIVWESVKESIHINHGSHFTSHFSIYDDINNVKSVHPYWGNISKYHHLF